MEAFKGAMSQNGQGSIKKHDKNRLSELKVISKAVLNEEEQNK